MNGFSDLRNEVDRRVVACLMEVIPDALSRCRYGRHEDLEVRFYDAEEEFIVWKAFVLAHGHTPSLDAYEEWCAGGRGNIREHFKAAP